MYYDKKEFSGAITFFFKKKENHWRTFVAYIVSGVVFENANGASDSGLSSINILVFAGTCAVSKVISIGSLTFNEMTELRPNFVENESVEAYVSQVRIFGWVLAVEKTIFIFVKSIGGE